MEQLSSTELVNENLNADKETTIATKAALESSDRINIHENVGHKVKTELKVTGG